MLSREQKDCVLRRLLRSRLEMKRALERSFRSPRPGLSQSPVQTVYRPTSVLPHPVTVHLSRRTSADSQCSTRYTGSFLTQAKKVKASGPISHERTKSHLSATLRSNEPWAPPVHLRHLPRLPLLPDFRVTIVHVEDVFSDRFRKRPPVLPTQEPR